MTTCEIINRDERGTVYETESGKKFVVVYVSRGDSREWDKIFFAPNPETGMLYAFWRDGRSANQTFSNERLIRQLPQGNK
jgi:hypothetical protein